MRSISSLPKSSAISKRVIFISSLVLLIAMAGVLFYTETHHITSFFIKTQNNPITAQQKEQATKSDPTTSSSPKQASQAAPGVSNSQTTDKVKVSNTMSIVITTASQSDNNVNVAVKISNPAPSGTCTFVLTKQGSKPVVSSVNTTNTTCAASMPRAEFNMSGEWQIEARYFADNAQATTQGMVTLQ